MLIPLLSPLVLSSMMTATDPVPLETRTLATRDKSYSALRDSVPMPQHKTVVRIDANGRLQYQCIGTQERPRLRLKKQP